MGEGGFARIEGLGSSGALGQPVEPLFNGLGKPDRKHGHAPLYKYSTTINFSITTQFRTPRRIALPEDWCAGSACRRSMYRAASFPAVSCQRWRKLSPALLPH